MKSTAFALFFLLSAITSYLPSATGRGIPYEAGFVLDRDGKFLRNGGTYYMVPSARGNGGGIERAGIGNDTCPITVVQSPSEDSKGLPLTFSTPARILYIHAGLLLKVRFTSRPPCAPSRSWKIVLDGDQDHPAQVKLTGNNTGVPGGFAIRTTSNENKDYKLMFCASGSPDNNDKCRDIGIYIDHEGNRRLVLTENNPLFVHFLKVVSSTASDSTGPEK